MARAKPAPWPLPREGEPDAFELPPSPRPNPGLVESVFVCDSDSEERMVEALRHADCYAVDTETTGLRVHRDKIIGVCVSTPPWKVGFYCPFFNSPEGSIWYREQRTFDRRREVLRERLESDVPKKFFNMLYDVPIFFNNLGIVVQNIVEDVMLKLHALNPDGEHGLKPASVCHIDPNADWYESELTRYNAHVGGSDKNARYWLIPPRVVAQYGGADAVYTGRLDDVIDPLLDPQARAAYYNTTIWLAHALLNMRIDGVPLDREYLARGAQWSAAYMGHLTDQMRQMVGLPEFNPKSPDQVRRLWYETLGLPSGRRSKRGYSTDEDELKRLRGAHPIIELQTEYRTVEKQKDSYFDALLEDADEHGIFIPDPKVNGTVLGRLSMNRLHQIPRGPLMRHAFVAGEGRVLVGGDYSQMDARVLAHLSGDPVLKDTFQRGLDVHSVTAKHMLHLDTPVERIEEEHPVERQLSKSTNFALFTGESVFGLMRQIERPREECQVLYDEFFKIYRYIKPWSVRVCGDSRLAGCVRTLYGRPRYVPGLADRFTHFHLPPRWPDGRPSCYAKQTRWGGLALSLRYDMGQLLEDWTHERAEAMRPMLAGYDREKCAGCHFLWGCYYTVDYRSHQRDAEEVDRKIISTIIQGSTADLVNAGVANAWEMIRAAGLDARIHLFVHDESVYSVPTTGFNIDLFCEDLRRVYEAPGVNLTVPLRYEPHVGNTWAEVKYGNKVFRDGQCWFCGGAKGRHVADCVGAELRTA